ncbi:Sad1 / UNC-like C-terminal [Popillia japonica]|uniref:Sad1 / UNC-like C-terminal n=1 Tax=Popillia japonica TaxID=7064 RepID=A0AAW1KP10_POPJA
MSHRLETSSNGLPNSSRSLPNVCLNNSTNINDIPIFNPADLLPIDDFDEGEGFCSKIKSLFCCLLKIFFIFIIGANIISLIIDPTPLLRVYEFITRPSPDVNRNFTCKVPQPDISATEMKHLYAKIHILRDDFEVLKKKIDLIEEWRLNMEYDVSKEHQKNLEEIGQYFMAIEQRIEEALSKYDADKLGMIDYALESAGGKIISTPDTAPYPASISWDFGYFRLFSPSPASQIIQAGTLPGQCFAFHGSTGKIRIRLAEKIQITSVTLEHSPFRLLSDFTSCPKTFAILGVEQPEDDEVIELGQFVFQNHTPLQNFNIEKSLNQSFQVVELYILDNYGKEEYTCVYRFRVHGIVADNGDSTPKIQFIM